VTAEWLTAVCGRPPEQAGEPTSEEGPQGGNAGADDCEVDFDVGVDEDDVVEVVDCGIEGSEEQFVNVDDAYDSDDGYSAERKYQFVDSGIETAPGGMESNAH
jgi:hypothetical protein